MYKLILSIVLFSFTSLLSAQVDSTKAARPTTIEEVMPYPPTDSSITVIDIMLVGEADSVKYGLRIYLPNDTCLFKSSLDSGYTTYASVVMGRKCLGPAFNKETQHWAFILSDRAQSTCPYCIHFDLGDATSVWWEPSGKLYWRSKGVDKVIYNNFGSYLYVMGTLLRIEYENRK